MSNGYRPRLLDAVIEQRLQDFPAISIVGPRASGKTTSARRHARTILRLDEPGTAAAVKANPDAALRDQPEPILIDEWQEAPTVLGAVKRTVDADPRPGRFLLTGSVRAELQGPVWPATGRVVHVPFTTIAVREQIGDIEATPVIERLARSGADELRAPASPIDVRDYLRLALAGGFPETVWRLPARARRTWLDSYAQQLVTHDAMAVDANRDPVRMRRFLDVLALNTAGVVDAKTLYDAAGINRLTAEAYEHLLQNLLVTEAIPAWFTNRLKRLVKMPKRYLVDAGLAAAIMNVDEDAAMRDHDLLGRLLDTFVVAQLRAELPLCASRPRLCHLRTEGGRREIDLIVELSADRVIGIEIKAAAAVGEADARHLAWLRDAIGPRFVHGLVLHAGPGLFPIAPRITAAPIAALWN